MNLKASSTFTQLQRVAESFESHAAGCLTICEELEVLQAVEDLGHVAIPLCIRKFVSCEKDATWAKVLLQHLSQSEPIRLRIIESLREQLRQTSHLAQQKRQISLLLARLSEIQVWLPWNRSGCATPLEILAANLTSPNQVSHIADILATKVSAHDLCKILRRISNQQPNHALKLIDHILIRGDIDDITLRLLNKLRDTIPCTTFGTSQTTVSKNTTVLYGSRGDGRTVLVAHQQPHTRSAVRSRAICCLIDPKGRLTEALYCDDFAPNGVENYIIAPLVSVDYEFYPIDREVASQQLTSAARLARRENKSVPTAFLAGCDLFGIQETDTQTEPTEDTQKVRFSTLQVQATTLLADGKWSQALPLLKRYTEAMPSDALGLTQLGLCHLQLGEVHQATIQLQHAANLKSNDPLLHWNCAAAYHRDGNLGGCYMSLQRYADFEDTYSGADERMHAAGQFLASYEQMARIDYPQADLFVLARADSDYHYAVHFKNTHQIRRAVSLLRKIVNAAPFHHPSWGLLGSLLVQLNRLHEAKPSLECALKLKPGYPAAVIALNKLMQIYNSRTTTKGRPYGRPYRPMPEHSRI